MFKSNLYLIPENTLPPANKPPTEAKVVVFVAQDDLSSDSNTMLHQILSAAKLHVEQDCIICALSPSTNNHYYNAFSSENVSKIIVFGLSPDKLSLHINPKRYTSFRFDGRRWIFAHSLGTLLEEKEKGEKQKRVMLWNAIKELFDI